VELPASMHLHWRKITTKTAKCEINLLRENLAAIESLHRRFACGWLTSHVVEVVQIFGVIILFFNADLTSGLVYGKPFSRKCSRSNPIYHVTKLQVVRMVGLVASELDARAIIKRLGSVDHPPSHCCNVNSKQNGAWREKHRTKATDEKK
jgi:hypothetical protein